MIQTIILYLIALLSITPQTIYGAIFESFYLGLSSGDLINAYESLQIQLAENAALLSDTYNFSFDRGFTLYPFKHSPHTRIQVDSHSHFEIKQHASAITLSDIAPKHYKFQPSIGLSILYNSDQPFYFLQNNLALSTKKGPFHFSTMINIPIKRTHTYESTLSKNLYQIAGGQKGAALSAAQKKDITNTLLNQHLTNTTTISNAYDEIIALQSNTTTNDTVNYTSVFSSYNMQSPDLYYDDLVSANKSGTYDYIAQYGLHFSLLNEHIYQNSIINAACSSQLSFYEKQTILNLSAEISDLTGRSKSILPQAQIVYQDNRFRLNGSLSLYFYFGKQKQKQHLPTQQIQSSPYFVNYTTDLFTATNFS